MLKRIDHIVIAVKDLETASAEFETAGFTVAPGGSHPTTGTHNALIPFDDDTYLELIAIEDPTIAASHPWFVKMDGKEGFVTFAVAADPIEYEAERLRTLGLTVPALRDGSRKRPDGQLLQWKSVQPESDPPAPLPFMIEDVTDRQQRVPGGADTRHKNGVIGTTGLTIVCGDLQQTMTAFSKMFSAPVAALDHGFEGIQQGWRYFLLEDWVDLIQTPSGDSPVAVHQRTYGDSIYQIYLSVDTGPEFPPNRIEIGGLPDVHILSTN